LDEPGSTYNFVLISIWEIVIAIVYNIVCEFNHQSDANFDGRKDLKLGGDDGLKREYFSYPA
jgi:hypothetical protein